MKALTVWQPWASLLMGGFKTYETRTWGPTNLGWLAIHAAKCEPKEAKAIGYTEPFYSCLKEIDLRYWHDRYWPRGTVLGFVYINAVLPAEEVAQYAGERDLAFGDFTYGRLAWRVNGIVTLPEPTIPCRGRQKLWTLPEEIIATLDLDDEILHDLAR